MYDNNGTLKQDVKNNVIGEIEIHFNISQTNAPLAKRITSEGTGEEVSQEEEAEGLETANKIQDFGEKIEGGQENDLPTTTGH